MSTSVSEQMKTPGNTAKNVEERNIPWSQQVDEASYENLSSPTGDENTCSHQSSMQFQYPPFNIKESQHVSWNNQKPRKQNSFDSNKKHVKTANSNHTKREDFQTNPWGNQKKGKHMTDNPSNINRAIRTENVYAMSKFENKAIVSTPLEDKKTVTTASAAPKKTTWASIASQPAKLALRTNLSTLSHKKKGPGMPPPPMVPGKHNLDVNTWELPNNNPPPVPSPPPSTDKSFVAVDPNNIVGVGCDYETEVQTDSSHKGSQYIREENKSNYNNSNYGRVRTSPISSSRKNWSSQSLEQNNRAPGNTNLGHIRRSDNNIGNSGYQSRFTERRNYTRLAEQESTLKDIGERNFDSSQNIDEITPEVSNAVLEKLYDKNNYNPLEIDLNIATSARFFVIKSYSEDDIHRSIKYEIWCSTDHGNKRLDDAFKERQKEGGQVLLFFSVNGSGHFCGMAQMITAVDYNSTSSVWSQDKWKGKFKVKWIYVKDVPNIKLRHIRLENNENKSVTNSRDTQEVPNAKGIEVLQILHCYKHITSIFDDFYHYEKKQEEEVSKKPTSFDNLTTTPPISRHYSRQSDDRDRERDIRTIGGPQKFFAGGNASFRERNNSYRGSFHNFNEQRRNESHKMNLPSDVQQKERDDRVDTELDRDNNEYGSRYGSKFDYIQRSKHTRDRDLSEKETRYRSSAKVTLKDNEYDY
ncbi:YTH domain-containing family protein [Zeugodacus cucurbitae]|uniref:YTH domain family protein 2 n=1 Tax=Zeugodacus cucurbitae TaxID=28588 RepID=A0A0A1WQ83_ZEUCU|nr:YTH domain-containing family protein [Zeugodacus cucurbitae]XP_054081434.1 YTH domain-containing family protein [Zeugodacus cucurbitae]